MTQGVSCGLHAWMGIEEALGYRELTTPMGWAVASVIGWGRVFFDEEETTGEWLARVAANYGAPILPLEELREYTLTYGEEYEESG